MGPQVYKFEQVSSDDHQMSVAGEGWGYGMYMMHVMYLSPLPRKQTQVCENMAFSQLLLRAFAIK